MPTSPIATLPSPLQLVPALAPVAAAVREECLLPANRFGPEFFAEHLDLVTRLALALAPGVGADPLVVGLAGYLHDLSAVRDFTVLPDHARESARLARELLPAQGFSPAIADAVARCAESHSTPARPGTGTPEEICVSSADVLSHLARPAYWCFYLFRVRGMDLAQGMGWLRGRAELYRTALVPEAQELGAADFAAFSRMLEPPPAAPPSPGDGSTAPG